MKIGNWSRFYRFEEVFEYYGVFDETGTSSREQKQVNGVWGVPHSNNGFRLRSSIGGRLSFSKLPLKDSLEELPCPLQDGDIGCYFIRIEINEGRWDYIGKSRELVHGIYYRLLDHLIKISGTGEANFFSTTSKFSEMNEQIKAQQQLDPSQPDFFSKHVKIAFVKVDRTSKEYQEHVSKIEGMALAYYQEKIGAFPNLNTTNETRGLEGLSNLL